ncbi:MAG: alpha/beta hydrolase-fold protein [Bacteroidota bacterium]
MKSLRLNSEIFSRQMKVYILKHTQEEEGPIFYVTDGEKMIEYGAASLIDSLFKKKLIPRAKYIFLSSIDPQTRIDHRNEYFFCNENYLDFFEKELIPAIEGKSKQTPERYLVGVSFGGLNAAYFAAHTDKFQGYALLSPISYPCEKLNQNLAFSQFSNYKVYLSTGKMDAESYVESLYPMLRSKTENIKLVHTKGGHDFDNWNAQLGNIINFMLTKP